MPNKSIYVSNEDVALFEEAKKIAGEGLSAVISKALREYVTRFKKRESAMTEISVLVGQQGHMFEKRFFARKLLEWKGLSDDKEWYLSAIVYLTEKSNLAIYLKTICKASLLFDKKKWKESGDYLQNSQKAELIVSRSISELKGKIPQGLLDLILLSQTNESKVEYLEI
jgi:EXLDI family protein